MNSQIKFYCSSEEIEITFFEAATVVHYLGTARKLFSYAYILYLVETPKK